MTKRPTKLHEQLRKEILSDPIARAEYEAFKLQLMLAEAFKKARTKAHLTQERVAKRMNTQKPVVARLEAAGGKGKHSPSIRTLVKFADAIGYDIKMRLVPQKRQIGTST